MSFASMMQPQRPAADKAEVAPATQRVPVVAPAVDIEETATAVVIHADMPGVDQSGVDLTVDRGVLTIRGQTRQAAPAGYTAVYQEYHPAAYERRFTLSDAVDGARINATIANGVLRVELAKAGRAVPRKIAVTAG
jgi:HSP20 family molecular chaperone IbpA